MLSLKSYESKLYLDLFLAPASSSFTVFCVQCQYEAHM